MADNSCHVEEEHQQKPVGLEVSRDGRGSPGTQTSKRLKHQEQQYQYQPGRQRERGNRNGAGSSAWLQTDQKIGKARGASFPAHRHQAGISKGYSQKPLVTRKMFENPWAELEQRCSS